jgi:stage II sporulation protein D
MRAWVILLICAAHSPAQVTYKVRLTSNEGNRIVELPAEKYVAAVLAGESSVLRSDEALKAMAVAARTYAARLRERHAPEGFDFCATTHCQRVDLQGITARVSKAAQATAGELLWFEGKPAFSVYSRSCGGMTEDVRAVWPDVAATYLKAHADPYCTRNAETNWSWSATPPELVKALRESQLQAPADLRAIVVSNQTPSGRAKALELEGSQTIAIAASSFRFAIGRALGWNTLRSERYEIKSDPKRIYFRGRGEGHGVGLCQRGADEMGLEGRTYREILDFYYPGTTVSLTGAGLQWTRLGGEGVTLFTTKPDRDRNVLGLAESLHREIATPNLEIRIYPDIDTFRNATGEPGWVAARTTGTRIEMQPAGVSRQTLRHEMLHVMVESQAVSGLPIWFREGLVEWLDDPAASSNAAARPKDADLQQRQDRARAQQAYKDARDRVAGLVHRYGETAVLDWLKRGLPAEVKNSIASNPATNSR